MNITELTYLGENVGRVLEKCIKHHDYRCLLVVDKFDDCKEFAAAIASEMNNSIHDEFTKHIKRVWVVHPTCSYVEFNNGSVLRVMHYYKPPTGSIVWGEKFNCVVDISHAPFDGSVEKYLQSVIVPYTYVSGVDCETPKDTSGDDNSALDEFLDGFTIIQKEGG